MTNETAHPARKPFDVRPHPLGSIIMSGPTDNDVILGAVYDKGPGSYDHEEMAKVWAAAYPVMFPALAEIRDGAAVVAFAGKEIWPQEIAEMFRRIYQRAKDALPVPTIGDLNSTAPAAHAAPSAATAQGWLDPSTYRKDGTLVRLLIEQPADNSFDDEAHPTDDVAAGETWETIGWNNAEDTDGETDWQFAGWDWSHDCWTEGRGKVVGWMPYHSAAPVSAPAPATTDALTETAKRIAWEMRARLSICYSQHDDIESLWADLITPDREACLSAARVSQPQPQPVGEVVEALKAALRDIATNPSGCTTGDGHARAIEIADAALRSAGEG